MANGDVRLVGIRKRQALWDEVIGRAIEIDGDGQATAAAVIEQQAPSGSRERFGAGSDIEARRDQHIEGVVFAHQVAMPNNHDSPRIAAIEPFL